MLVLVRNIWWKKVHDCSLWSYGPEALDYCRHQYHNLLFYREGASCNEHGTYKHSYIHQNIRQCENTKILWKNVQNIMMRSCSFSRMKGWRRHFVLEPSSIGRRLSVVKFVAICDAIQLICQAASRSWSCLASMPSVM